MAIPPHSKPRHKKAPNKRSIIRWCVGTAMLTATALIISIPPDHARRRQHPTSSQRQSVRSHHHQHRKQGNPRKQTAGETLQRAPRKPNQQPNRRRTRNAKSRRIQSATRHPTQRRHGNHQLPETRHQPTHTSRNKRTDARHRRRALGRHIPANRGSGNPYRHHRTPGPRRQTHVHQTRPSPRR